VGKIPILTFAYFSDGLKNPTSKWGTEVKKNPTPKVLSGGSHTGFHSSAKLAFGKVVIHQVLKGDWFLTKDFMQF